MEHREHLADLRRTLNDWRASGARIAFVPTMGNLHRGHLTLIQEARARADRVIASVFVNPLQFGPGEDLDAYPRTLEQDRRLLAETGCDLLFTPKADTMYPHGQAVQTFVEVPGISDILCGATRPGHFRGVATVVCKLLNMVRPDVALFGEKDFQQLLVIRRMVEDLSIPVEIVGIGTVRESDGLAMSSRNGYLSTEERGRAAALYRALNLATDRLRRGDPPDAAERIALETLDAAGMRPDYVSIRTAATLGPVADTDTDLVVLGAAYLGRTRLIDNVRVTRDTGRP